MATKKKPSTEAPAAPAKFPARARKKVASTEVAPEVPAAEAVTTEAPAAVVVAPAPAVAAPVAVEAVEPTVDAIRARAYALWRAEGGSAQANWLRAEAELRGR
jgi:hypothetical protein